MNELDDADKALCVAYLDGLLPEGQKLAFEMRLSGDPELAKAMQRLIATDELVRRLSVKEGVDVQRARRARPWVWAASIAAAAAILGFLAIQLLRKPARPSFEVAIAPSFESASEYIESVPELRGLRPPGIDVLRSGNETPNIEAQPFLAKAAAAETSDPLARTETTATFFVIPLELERPGAVSITAFTRDGRRLDLFPEGGGAQQVAAGRTILPGARFVAGAAGVQYSRGFLVPVGAGTLEVLVAVGSAELGATPAVTPGANADEHAAALERAGYTVRRLRVVEPPH